MKTSSRAQEKREKRTSFPIICLRRNRRTTLRTEAHIVSAMLAGAGPFLTAQREAHGAAGHRREAATRRALRSCLLGGQWAPPGQTPGLLSKLLCTLSFWRERRRISGGNAWHPTSSHLILGEIKQRVGLT